MRSIIKTVSYLLSSSLNFRPSRNFGIVGSFLEQASLPSSSQELEEATPRLTNFDGIRPNDAHSD